MEARRAEASRRVATHARTRGKLRALLSTVEARTAGASDRVQALETDLQVLEARIGRMQRTMTTALRPQLGVMQRKRKKLHDDILHSQGLLSFLQSKGETLRSRLKLESRCSAPALEELRHVHETARSDAADVARASEEAILAVAKKGQSRARPQRTGLEATLDRLSRRLKVIESFADSGPPSVPPSFRSGHPFQHPSSFRSGQPSSVLPERQPVQCGVGFETLGDRTNLDILRKPRLSSR